MHHYLPNCYVGGNRRRSPLAKMCATFPKSIQLHLLIPALPVMSTEILSRDKTVPVLSGKRVLQNMSSHLQILPVKDREKL